MLDFPFYDPWALTRQLIPRILKISARDIVSLSASGEIVAENQEMMENFIIQHNCTS